MKNSDHKATAAQKAAAEKRRKEAEAKQQRNARQRTEQLRRMGKPKSDLNRARAAKKAPSRRSR